MKYQLLYTRLIDIRHVHIQWVLFSLSSDTCDYYTAKHNVEQCNILNYYDIITITIISYEYLLIRSAASWWVTSAGRS